jgi:GH24 family phage-related lysozyme (muramidase)
LTLFGLTYANFLEAAALWGGVLIHACESAMQVSKKGRMLIEAFEGPRLEAYRDAIGVWTIGYGHTARAGKPVPIAGLSITSAMADQILANDLDATEKGVLAAIKRPMEQGQFDAMVSLAFNIGLGAFRSSSVARCFNRGQVLFAADAFRLWVRAGGHVFPGLVKRREAERQEFLFAGSQDPPAAPVAIAHAVDHPHGTIQRLASRIELAFAGAWA